MRTKGSGFKGLTCLDFGTSGVKVVRMNRDADGFSIAGAAVLPPIPMNGASRGVRLNIPRPLRANYAAVCAGDDTGIIRLITLPSEMGGHRDAEARIRDQFNIDATFRLQHTSLSAPSAKTGTRVLAVAIPEQCIETILSLTAHSAPAAASMGISGLAAFNSFLHQQELREGSGEESACFIEAGSQTISFFFVSRKRLVLVRKFDVGGTQLLERIQQELEVDTATAHSVLVESAIDISALITSVLGFVIRQLSISRDFVERQEGCRIQHAYLSGGLAISTAWRQTLKDAMGIAVEVFDPLTPFRLDPDAWPSEFQHQSPRFSAAIGAGLGTFRGGYDTH